MEWCGDGFIGLYNKTYYCFGCTVKHSTEVLSKHHNEIEKVTFLAVLTDRKSGNWTNRVFRVMSFTTYRGEPHSPISKGSVGYWVVVVSAVVSVVVDATQHNSFRQGAEIQVVVRMRHETTACDIDYNLQTTRRSWNLTIPFQARPRGPAVRPYSMWPFSRTRRRRRCLFCNRDRCHLPPARKRPCFALDGSSR